MGDGPPDDVVLSRRRLFGLGVSTVGLTAVLAACGSEEPPAPGRVGNAPEITDLPEGEVDDIVLLRTLTSLEHSIVTVYAALADIDGLDAGVSELLGRFSDDHVATAATFAELTSAAGGEPYECPNSWLMDRTLDPLLDHILGATVDDEEIPATDDADRDSLATVNALETIAAATAQQYLERLADPMLRVEVITAGTSSSRRAATSALRANPPPDGLRVAGADRRRRRPARRRGAPAAVRHPLPVRATHAGDVGRRCRRRRRPALHRQHRDAGRELLRLRRRDLPGVASHHLTETIGAQPRSLVVRRTPTSSQRPNNRQPPAASLNRDGESAGWPRHDDDRAEESRDSNGHGAGEMPGRGDLTEQCNREQTADGRGDPDQARVKRCGKSAPAFGATRTARQTPPGARSSRRHGRPVRPATQRGNLRVDRTDGWPPAARKGGHRIPLTGRLTVTSVSSGRVIRSLASSSAVVLAGLLRAAGQQSPEHRTRE